MKSIAHCAAVSVLFAWVLIGCAAPTRTPLSHGAPGEVHPRRQEAAPSGTDTIEAEPVEVSVGGDLILQDAISLALVNNKRILATLDEREIARGEVLSSYSEILPSVDLVGSYIREDETERFTLPDGSRIRVNALDNYGLGLTVTQPVFRGGASFAEVRAARLSTQLADAAVRRVVQETIFLVSRDYYDVLLARRLFETNRESVRSAEATLREVREKREQGVATRYDVLRAEVELSNFRAAVIEQQNRVRTTTASLLRNMGVAQEAEIRCIDVLRHTPWNIDRREATRIALENRPELIETDLGVRIQSERVTIARSRYSPQVDLFFTQQFARPEPTVLGRVDRWDDRWFAGVQVEVPIFDGLRREGRLVQEKARLQQLRHEFQEVEEHVRFQVERAVASLEDNDELVRSQSLNLERATEARRLVEVGYREGIRRPVEVTDARAALNRAEALYYQALHSHAVSSLELRLALGRLGPETHARESAAEAKRERHDR